MNYIEVVTKRIDAKLPDNDPELNKLYALLALTMGLDTDLEDVHNAWALWRNETNPEHKSLVPFNELDEDVQLLDEPYRDAIVEVARQL